MKLLHKIKANEPLFAWLNIIFGCFVAAAAYPMFLTPHNIAPGGLTGVAVILNYLFRVPVGTTSLLLGIPLLIIGWRTVSAQFALRTLGATAIFSILIDILPFPNITDDYLMATIFGAILLGAGLAIIMTGNATTGGTDMLAEMLHRRFPSIRVGVILATLDGCVVLGAWFSMGAKAALYALCNIYICTRVIDKMLSGWGSAKACYITTDYTDAITQRIMSELNRGVTHLEATGAYSGQRRRMILCVAGGREIPRLKRIIKEEDPKAFIFITDTHETLGEGFAQLK